VLEKTWKIECPVLEFGLCEGGYKCTLLTDAIKRWNPAQEHLARILSELEERKRKHSTVDLSSEEGLGMLELPQERFNDGEPS